MQKQLSILISSLVFLLPLTFWTLTPNFFTTPKQLMLIIFTVLTLLIWLINSLRHKSITFTITSLTYPLGIFIIGLIINLFTTQEATTEALIGPGSLYLTSAVLALIISSTKKLQPKADPPVVETTNILTALLASSTILAIHSILQLTFLHTLPSLPTYMNTRTFSLASSPLIALSILIIGIVTSITWATNAKSNHKRAFLLTSTAIQTIALVAYLSLMITGGELTPILLPLTTSWSITLDSLKTTRNIFLGVGLANFTPFYTSVKPLILNNGIFWNTLPTNASNELLQLLTTGGLILFLPFFFLISQPFSSKLSTKNKQLKASIFTTLLIFIFTPGSTVITPFLFILLALSSNPKSTHTLSLNTNSSRLLTLTLNLSLIIITLFYSGKVVLAETHMRRAQLAITDQDGQAVYEHHLQAIKLIPTITNYHLSYSQVNLQLASSLSQSKELTEDQRTQVTQLLSQAVREARIATSLRPSLTNTWSNLGFIYRNLINVADGAEDLAIQNYATAISLDPANSSLRVELGGIFYQLANATEDKTTTNNYLIRAIEEFTTATQLKPDYANAWYNLAKSYESAGNIELAHQAMQQTIASLDVDSPDLNTATQELSALEAKLPRSEAKTPNEATNEVKQPPTISEPSPLPSPLPGGPINLESTPSATN